MPNFIERIFIAIGRGIALGFCEAMRNECEPKPIQNSFSVIPMFIVKADNPDVNFRIGIVARDSEGNAVPASAIDPAKIEVDVLSTNDELVEIVFDDDNDPLTGIVRFGRPSASESEIASVEVRASYDGVALTPVGAQFMITVGDPAQFDAPTITFDGLTDTPVDEPTEGGETGGETGEDTEGGI
jgi:hypothetical protein